MPDITEGLEVGGQIVDPSTDAGFAAVLESRGVEPDPEGASTPSRNVNEGLSTHESVVPGRDPATGRFVSNQEAAAAGQSQQDAGSSAGEVVPSEDPILAAFLEQHGGDPDAALKAAAHQNALLGRQANEVGATRQENQELRERLARMEGQLTALATAAPVAPPLSLDDIEATAQSLTANGGYYGAALSAINDYSSDQLYDRIVNEWAAVEPIAAQRFDMDYQQWKAQQAAPAPAAEPTQSWQSEAEQQAKVTALTNDFSVIEAEYGGKEAFAPVLDKMSEALDSMPPNVLQMVDSLDPEARQAGLRLVADRAARIAAVSGAAPVVQGEPAADVQAASVARKLGASVATSAARPAAAPTNQPQNREEAIMQFKRDLVATETTNVREGLTYGAPLPGFAPRT